MRILGSMLRGALLAAGLGGMLWAGAAMAGPHVERLPDGTVLLKLGPLYGDAVIETSVGELGPLLGGTSPAWPGTTVRLLTQDEGPHGAISGPIEALRPVWEELTGARLELGLVPVGELHAQLMLDLGRAQHGYDAAVVAAYFYGDLIAGNHLLPVDPLLASGRFPNWSYDDMPPALRALHHWDGVGYGVRNDADGQVLYYRRDVLNDPANQQAFQAALGYALPVPPGPGSRSWTSPASSPARTGTITTASPTAAWSCTSSPASRASTTSSRSRPRSPCSPVPPPTATTMSTGSTPRPWSP